jgi:hypothetical protein
MGYENGKIYKLVSNVSDKVYYGSTINPLHMRLLQHRASSNKCASKSIIDDGSHDIVLVEWCECDSRKELHARERYHIENNECINKTIPTRTSKQYKLDNKDRLVQYRLDNKDKIVQYRLDNRDKIAERHRHYYQDNKDRIENREKQYRLDNRDKIADRGKQYRLDNKDTIREKNKQYREDNKDKVAERKKQYYQDNKDKIARLRKGGKDKQLKMAKDKMQDSLNQ